MGFREGFPVTGWTASSLTIEGADGGAGVEGGDIHLTGGDGDAVVGSGADFLLRGGRDTGEGGEVNFSGGSAGAGEVGGDIIFTAGEGDNGATTGVRFQAQGGQVGAAGKMALRTSNSYGLSGQAIVSDGNSELVYGGVRVAAAVPVAAPDGYLPFAYDTTAVTGGFYFWNGAAWVKVANIL